MHVIYVIFVHPYKKIPEMLIRQSSEDSPDTVGMCFVADVLKRNQQLILVLREAVT